MNLFGSDRLAGWDPTEANSFERARFVLQMEPCDVLVVDTSLFREGNAEGLARLAGHEHTPVLLLAEADPELIVAALHEGAHYWLPRDLVFDHPEVLDGVLHQAVRIGALERGNRAAVEAVRECQLQVSRLVSLLWEAAPGAGRSPWFTQRHMLERLEEEVARTQRFGGPLSVVLGEMQGPHWRRVLLEEAPTVAAWTVSRLSQAKRCSDVAGQYGLHGFMLILPRVAETEAARCCERLRSVLEQPPPLTIGAHLPLQACFGIASYSSEVATVKGLLSRAEESLEQAKNASSTAPKS
jgi:hypothetical protein